MKGLLVVALILGAALAAPKRGIQFRNLFKKPVGTLKHAPSGRITNGQIADPHSIPYQVFLEIFNKNGEGWYCGGSLIKENVVLTAARCTDIAVQALVVLGAHDLTKEEDTQVLVFSDNIVVHEDYNLNTLVNDIALIRLPKPVPLTDAIQVIKLPSAENASETYAGDLGFVTGWGVTSGNSDTFSEELRYTQDVIMTNEDCGEALIAVPDTQICLSGVRGHGTCNGDTGGPMAVARVQVGIASYGVVDCMFGYPSVFTRVTSYLDWIERNS